MATLKGSKEIKNAVLHVLAKTGDALSPAEVAEILGIKQGLVSRALFDARRDRPPVIQLSASDKNRFEFITGNEASLEPLPDDVLALIPAKNAGKARKAEPTAKTEKPSTEDLGSIKGEIAGLFHNRKKIARSDIHEKLSGKYSVEEIDPVVEELVSGKFLTQTPMDEFEEDILGLTKKGQSLLENADGNTPAPAVKAEAPARKAPARKAPAKKEVEPAVEKPIQKTAGRPSGDRDISELRDAMVEYIADKEDVSKSDVSRNLSPQLERFGRKTIGQEFMKMIDEGVLEQSQDKNGAARLGRYRMATDTAKAPARAEKPALAAASKPQAKPPESKMEDLDKLKQDLEKALDTNGEGLSRDVGGLFDRVVDYVKHLEETNQRLRSQMISMIENMR